MITLPLWMFAVLVSIALIGLVATIKLGIALHDRLCGGRERITGPCKRWWHSKTLWFNAICAALIALEATTSSIVQDPMTGATTGVLQQYLPVNFYIAMVIALPIVNAVLRIITTQGLKK